MSFFLRVLFTLVGYDIKGQGFNLVEHLASIEKRIKPPQPEVCPSSESQSFTNVNYVLLYWDQNNRQREVHSIQIHHHYQTIHHWQDTAIR